MANATENLIRDSFGPGGPQFHLPVKGTTHIYEGTLCSQVTSSGLLVPYSTASSDPCVGVAQHEADNSAGADAALRCMVETKRMYAFTNGAGGDAFADTDLIGSVVYATDDHTVAKSSSTQTRKAVGFFFGFEDDSKVRVFIDPPAAKIVNALQGLADTPASADALRDAIVAAFG